MHDFSYFRNFVIIGAGDDMYRLKEDHMDELEIKKSRFLCYMHKCFSEEEAKAFLQQIKKEHPNATHHCYAFIIGEQNELQRSNDDGEPSGTAGVPILECLMNNQMQDIIAVVVRYFGGIKLGAGGLIRAYSKSVSTALKSAVLTKKETMQKYQITFSYDLIGKLDYYFRTQQLSILDKIYDEMVTYTFLSKTDLREDFSELSNGAYLPEYLETIIIDVDQTII